MQQQNLIWIFIPALFVVAFLYASVGHGGASGYLALMALFGFSPLVMKSTALVLNIFVSLIAFVQYYNDNQFYWKLFFPFSISSIPASFIGAYLSVNPSTYKIVLGVLLFFPILKLLGAFGNEIDHIKKINIGLGLIFGAVIGVFSGMIGIGGGIILSPIILLMHWGTMKQTAAVSALFIFVNSIAGLGGALTKGIKLDDQVWIWLSVAMAGAFLGAYTARKNMSNKTLKYILASVLLLASIKLLTVTYK